MAEFVTSPANCPPGQRHGAERSQGAGKQFAAALGDRKRLREGVET
jgi:hypothetical protein